MVETEIRYEGDLRCRAIHGPSGQEFLTDAPVDNQGQGRSFSPTDLLGVSMASCMLTIMGIVAKRHAIDLTGAAARVRKHMVADPHRRIGRLEVLFDFPRPMSEDGQQRLKNAALTCPVHRSVHPDMVIDLQFTFGH